MIEKTRKNFNLKQNRLKLAIINLAEYNIHMHEIKVQNVFLCTNPEKVPSVSEANRHFMWISKQFNHFLVIKQIGSGFNILRISFCLHLWALASFNTFAAMTNICLKSRFLDFSRVCTSRHFSVGDRIPKDNMFQIEKSLRIPKRSDTFSYNKNWGTDGVPKFWKFWVK